MTISKFPCLFQGSGKENPVLTGGYDMIRRTDDIDDPDYWVGSGTTTVYDAGCNQGRGCNLSFPDRLRISKGAVGNCTATVTLDVEANPLVFSYYPPHSLDVIFVLDVTASMMSNGSRKMALAKRALIQTINLLWQQNRETRVTIVPFARDAYIPNPGGGFSYRYLGTLFTWRRSTTSGNIIGQILGYRNGSYVSSTDIPTYMARSAPIAASVELSLYNYYTYYKIRYSDIYNSDGSPKPDTVLQNYLTNVYSPDVKPYLGNFITAVATGTPLLPDQLPYSMNDTGYENNTILDNMIWAIPYGEDTNTEAGLLEACTLLRTPGFTQSDDILRRAVVLITDGQANRSINPQYPGVYATPASTNNDFFPETAGEPWRYFLYLQQTLPYLISEISSRSATAQELVLALTRAYEMASRIKNPTDGNASLFVLGIEIDAQTPGPYTREDVLNIMRTIASTGSYLREATEYGTGNPIIGELERLVRDLFVLTGGIRAVITDTINTALFRYVPGTLAVTGQQDGILLKSRKPPEITDPDDPDYTVYVKPALLPDVSDENVQNGVITVDLGTIPFPLSSPDSRTRIRLTYDITSKGTANGTHLHTNVDEETYVEFREPSHLTAVSTELSYNSPPRILYFPTPVVACSPDYTVEKFVGTCAHDVSCKSLTVAACQDIYYRIVVRNHTDRDATFPLLYDVQHVNSAKEARLSGERRLLAENFTVMAEGYREFTFREKSRCGDRRISDYVILETGNGHLYDNVVVEVKDGPVTCTVMYLDQCTGRCIRPEILLTGQSACRKIPACRHVKCIPGWEFVCAQPGYLDLCKGERVLKLYYTACRRCCDWRC